MVMLSSKNQNEVNHNEHSNGNESNGEKGKAMPIISFQSKTNPKVQITLEFADKGTSEKAEMELGNILKNMYLEKIKKGAFQYDSSALESTLQNDTEEEEHG